VPKATTTSGNTAKHLQECVAKYWEKYKLANTQICLQSVKTVIILVKRNYEKVKKFLTFGARRPYFVICS